MKHLITISLLFMAFPLQLAAGWLDDVNAIHTEIHSMTANEQGLSGEQRLERYYQLSHDLSMLENPGFATYKGDPRGQNRLSDLSETGIERRRQADRDSLALIRSIDRASLSETEKVNYDLLLDDLERDVQSQRFPSQYLPMNQMGGPQQSLARLLSMMPSGLNH